MKRIKAVLGIVLMIFVAMVHPGFLYADPLDQVNQEIDDQESRNTIGLILGIGGLACEIVGLATYQDPSTNETITITNNTVSAQSPNNTVSYVLYGAGAVALIGGGYMFFDSNGELNHLRSRKRAFESKREGLLNFGNDRMVFSVPRVDFANGKVTTTLASLIF